MKIHDIIEGLDSNQRRVGQVGGEESAKSIGQVLGKKPKQHPFKGRLVGETHEQLDELSPQTLASYKKKAGADASAADKRGDFERGNKRFKGIVQATKKEFDHDARTVKKESSDNQHGSPYDRGAADSWYNRPRKPNPNYTPQQQAEYNQGYDDNEKSPDMRKDYR